MTDWASWFQIQLKASGDGFVWAIHQIDTSLHLKMPPDADYFGTWPPVRHVWHVAMYEKLVVVPSMMQWLDDPTIPEIEWDDGNEAWKAVGDKRAVALTAVFHKVRQQQTDLLPQFSPDDWNRPIKTVWGFQPLSMVVTKTFQHTYEHSDTLLRMGLWWQSETK